VEIHVRSVGIKGAVRGILQLWVHPSNMLSLLDQRGGWENNKGKTLLINYVHIVVYKNSKCRRFQFVFPYTFLLPIAELGSVKGRDPAGVCLQII